MWQAHRHGSGAAEGGWLARVIPALSVFTMAMTVPQVWAVWVEQETQGVSLLSWGAYLLAALPIPWTLVITLLLTLILDALMIQAASAIAPDAIVVGDFGDALLAALVMSAIAVTAWGPDAKRCPMKMNEPSADAEVDPMAIPLSWSVTVAKGSATPATGRDWPV